MFGYTSSSAPQLADTKVKRASREIAALLHVVRPVPASRAARHDARRTSEELQPLPALRHDSGKHFPRTHCVIGTPLATNQTSLLRIRAESGVHRRPEGNRKSACEVSDLGSGVLSVVCQR